jgi:peptidoglycan/LPS O-acetylase OafA/YrhL
MNRSTASRDLAALPALSYRPEVDGLRAVAILLVVFYHAGLGFSGGFVGVDVFFVISGYLITSLILKRMTDGTFTLGDFLERRIRRIIPAGVAMVVAVMVAGWFLLLPSDFVDLSKAAVSQTVFAANIYFYKTTNYFAGASEEKPLLHTWSLAVEEQFYLLFPLFLLILCKRRWLWSQGALIGVISLGVVAGFVVNMLNIGPNPIATFYLLPMRAWELLLGSLVAVVPAPPKRLADTSLPLLGLLQWGGVAMIIAAGTLYTSETVFPGFNALLPCVGAALFIWSSSPEEASTSLPGPKRFLSMRWMVFIGLISYSLYLWHWPLFAFTRYFSLEALSVSHRFGLVLLSIACAVVSYQLIERPFRRPRPGSRRSKVFLSAGASLLLMATCGLLVVATGGAPARFSERIVSYDRARLTRMGATSLPQLALSDAREGRLPSFGSQVAGATSVVVWGDSHAQSILPALETIAAGRPLHVAAAWFPRTPPLLNYVMKEPYSQGADTPQWSEAVLSYIEAQKVPHVILAARWSLHFGNLEAAGSDGSRFNAALLDTVRAVRNLGAQVWLVEEIPGHKADPVKALVRKEIFGSDVSHIQGDAESLSLKRQALADAKAELAAEGVRFLDIAPMIRDEKSRKFLLEKDGTLMFFDSNHLTREGAAQAAELFLAILDAKP